MKRTVIVPTVAAAALLSLAACSSATKTSAVAMNGMSTSAASSMSASSGAHNQADVTFATDMIPHHRQAVQMADMAMTQATNAEVKMLAQAIKAAQDPEITQMSGWLTGWGQPVPASDMAAMGTGMMSDADMASLSKASGAAFDRMWVTMMVQHHRGAISMATTEQSSGQNPDAKALAQSIVTSQTAQVSQLTALLAKLPN